MINMKSVKKRNIKYILLLLVLSASIATTSDIYSQNSRFTMEVTVTDASSPDNADGSIIVEIQSNQDGFIYVLFDKEPKEGGVAIAYSEQINEQKYTFSHLKAGHYYVCVTDPKNNSRCQFVVIFNK